MWHLHSDSIKEIILNVNFLSYLTACEVGKFGDQCQRDCSVNCISSPCDHVTGQCKSDCLKGWEGFNCTEGLNI